jgi:hypothetical protein
MTRRKRPFSRIPLLFLPIYRQRQQHHRQRLKHDHEHMLAEQGTDLVDVIGGQKGQPAQHRQPPATAVALYGIANGRRRNQRAQVRHQPPRPILRPKQPDQGHNHHVKEGRIVGGVEGIFVVAAVGPFPLAEQHRIHQLKALTLVVVKRKLEQGKGVDGVDDEIAHKGQQRQNQQQPRQPDEGGFVFLLDKWHGLCVKRDT